MNEKQNDWFLNSIANPTFTTTNFENVGLTPDNTGIKDKNSYKNLDYVRLNPMFLNELGKFDEAKFDQVYNYTVHTYNNFVNDKFAKSLVLDKTPIFSKFDMYVDKNDRNLDQQTVFFSREANPLKQTRGIVRINEQAENKYTAREVAETLDILLNPVDYANGAEAKWGKSPNNSFWDRFFDTSVLAQWDDNGEHKDPVTGQMVKHQKGLPKVNAQGYYYYEDLDGRDIYGRLVLSKLDILTTDGSAWNKYDVFDSDDKEKSWQGALFRNLLTIAPMMLPYIGPWYIAAGIAMESAKFGSVLGKMFLGSDSPTLSSIEGWATSWDPSTSDHTMNDPWTIENFLNMGGDVFKQLYQQRWLFQYAPAILQGDKAIINTESYMAKFKYFKDLRKEESVAEALKYLGKTGKEGLSAEELSKLQAAIKLYQTVHAEQDMAAFKATYDKIGKYISQAYMTGITVLDAYGRAKAEGATNTEATLLMLGYAAGEYAIINSRLGEWILPELRMNKQRWSKLVQEMSKVARKDLDKELASLPSDAAKQVKYNWMQKIFNYGKKLANADYSVAKRSAVSVASNGLGEGIEEVTEEFWLDSAKQLYNLAHWFAGDDRRLTAWDNMKARYGMSFLGGLLGGTMMDLSPTMKAAKEMNEEFTTIKPEAIWQEVVKMARNGELEEFRKYFNKNVKGYKHLSTKTVELEDGTYDFKEGTSEDNQDLALRTVMNRMFDFVDDTLSAHGASLSDEAIIDQLVLDKLRFLKLHNSSIMSKYIARYNELASKLVSDVAGLNHVMRSGDNETDTAKNKAEKQIQIDQNTLNIISAYQEDIKADEEALESFLNGEEALKYKQLGLFEMHDLLVDAYTHASYVRYAEALEKMSFDKISQKRQAELYTQWKNYVDNQLSDDIKTVYARHKYYSELFAPYLEKHINDYFNNRNDETYQDILALSSIISSSYQELNSYNGDALLDLTNFNIQNNNARQSMAMLEYLLNKYGTPNDLLELETIRELPEEVENPIQTANYLYSKGLYLIQGIVEGFKSLGFINPEIKEALLNTLSVINGGLDEESEDLMLGFELVDELEQLAHSDTIQLLDLFSLVSKSKTKASLVIGKVNLLLNNIKNASQFRLDNLTLEEIHAIEELCDLVGVQLLAARTDAADLLNVYGFNATLQEIDSEYKGLTIDKTIADVIFLDLKVLRDKLIYARRLVLANNTALLRESEDSGNLATVLLYKRLKDVEITGWHGFDKFKETIDSLDTLDELSKADKLEFDDSKREDIYREAALMGRAIYDLFNSDENAENRKDKEALKQFIKGFKLSLFDSDNNIINNETTSISSPLALWQIITRCALKIDDFYHDLLKTDRHDLISLPIQEEAAYTVIASLANGNVIQDLGEAYNEVVADQITELGKSEDPSAKQIIEKFELDPLYPYTSDFAPVFNAITFIEGLPGVGKTNGVLKLVSRMIQLNESLNTLSKNVVVVGPTKKFAEELSANLEFDKAHSYDILKFYEKYFPGWKREYELNNGLNTGNLAITESDVVKDENHVLHTKLEPSQVDGESMPTLIIMDEVSLHSYLDVDGVNKLSKKFGIPVIVSGDLQQSCATGVYSEVLSTAEDGSQKVMETEARLRRNYFNLTVRLGTIVRTENSQQSRNVRNFLAILDDATEGRKIPTIPLFYVDSDPNNPGLYGTRFVLGNGARTTDAQIDSLLPTIDTMVSTLNEGEKIYLITSDPSVGLSKVLLTSPKYLDKIEKVEGLSQGSEGRYYITDFVPTTIKVNGTPTINTVRAWTDAYTAISRAKQGMLFVWNGNFPENADQSNPISNIREKETMKVEVDNQSRDLFNLKHNSLLASIFTEGSDIKYIPRRGNENNIQVNTENDTEVYLDDEGQLIAGNGVSDTDTKNLIVLLSSSPEYVGLPIFGDDGSLLNLLLYSNFCTETGLITEIQPDGSKVWKLDENVDDKYGNTAPNWRRRIDSVNGILNFTGISDNQVEELLSNPDDTNSLLQRLRHEALSNPEIYGDTGILKVYKDLLEKYGLPISNLIGTFVIKSSAPYESSNGPFKKKLPESTKDAGERLEGMYIEHEGADTAGVDVPHRKTLSFIIGDSKGRDLLEIPLLILPNILTILKNPELSAFKSIYDALPNSYDKLGDFQIKLESLKQTNPTMKGLDLILTLMDMWRFTLDGIAPCGDMDWTFAKHASTVGMRVINSSKGLDYEFKKNTLYSGKWVPLTTFAFDGVRNVSKVLMSPKGTYKVGDTEYKFAKPGMPFVLVSSNGSLTQQQLIDTYLDELDKPDSLKTVARVYLVPPKASLLDYIDNIGYILNRKTTNVTGIGNRFTAYRILQLVFKNGNPFTDTLTVKIEGVTELLSALEEKDIAINTLLTENQSLQSELTRFDKASDEYKSRSSKILLNNAKIKSLRLELLEILKKPVELFTKVTPVGEDAHLKKVSVQEAFLAILYNLVYENFAGVTEGPKLNQENFDIIANAVKNANFEGIYFNIKYDKEKSNDAIVLAQNNGAYTISYNGQEIPFMINGKIDLPSYYIDVLPIIRNFLASVVKKSTSSGAINTTKYTENYNEHQLLRSLSETEVKKTPLQIVTEAFGSSLSVDTRPDSAYSSIKLIVETTGITDINAIIIQLKDMGHAVFETRFGRVITPKMTDIFDAGTIIQSLDNGGSESQQFNVSSQGKNYIATVTFNNGTATKIELLGIPNVNPEQAAQAAQEQFQLQEGLFAIASGEPLYLQFAIDGIKGLYEDEPIVEIDDVINPDDGTLGIPVVQALDDLKSFIESGFSLKRRFGDTIPQGEESDEEYINKLQTAAIKAITERVQSTILKVIEQANANSVPIDEIAVTAGMLHLIDYLNSLDPSQTNNLDNNELESCSIIKIKL